MPSVNVTIYSDASLCTNTQAGGWAGWIKSDRGTLMVDGCLKQRLRDTTIAEAMAAMNALSMAIKHGAVFSGDLIILTTDNDNVMSVLRGEAKRRVRRKAVYRKKISFRDERLIVKEANAHIATISEYYGKLLDKYKFDVRWHHVKAHRGKKDRRAAVNHGCDKRARASMRKARADTNSN